MKALYRKAKGAEIWERSWGQGRGAKDLFLKMGELALQMRLYV